MFMGRIVMGRMQRRQVKVHIREEMQIEVNGDQCKHEFKSEYTKLLDGLPPLKSDHITIDPPAATHEDSVVRLWRENDIGLADKKATAGC
nr:hypothetical protein [Tanacetum cinerariifolium]